MKPNEVKRAQISVPVTMPVHRAFRRAAHELEITAAELARRALGRGLELVLAEARGAPDQDREAEQ